MRPGFGKENYNLSVNDDSGIGEHQCSVCKKNFASNIVLRTHKKTAHAASKAFYCDQSGCKVKCTTLMRLKLHKQQAHKVKLESFTSSLAVEVKKDATEEEIKKAKMPSKSHDPEEGEGGPMVTLFRLEDHPYVKLDMLKRYGKIIKRRRNRSMVPILAPKPYIQESNVQAVASNNHREPYEMDIILSHDNMFAWNGHMIRPGPVSSKPWNKYYCKPGPACSKTKKPKLYKPGPACSKRRKFKVKGERKPSSSGPHSLTIASDQKMAKEDTATTGKGEGESTNDKLISMMEVQEENRITNVSALPKTDGASEDQAMETSPSPTENDLSNEQEPNGTVNGDSSVNEENLPPMSRAGDDPSCKTDEGTHE